MKIKSIEIKNNNILGDIEFDFTNSKGEIADTVIIAGENGTGKSTLLNIIYEFTNYHSDYPHSTETRKFIIEISDEDALILSSLKDIKAYFTNGIYKNEISIFFDYSKDGWDQIKISYYDSNQTLKSAHSVTFVQPETKPILKTMFSDVEINYSPNRINSVTATNLDEKIKSSIKSTPNLATEISQLLVDINALDAEDFLQWGKLNLGIPVDSSKIGIRIRRFKDAFEFMFSGKTFKGVNNEAGFKQILFEEYGKEIKIEDLSSGEKQVVFRGGFLLKNQKSSNGAPVLIDEPEISLHPNWQLKIVDFYKKLFTDDTGRQTSQLFFVTHSPFIIHNNNRHDDKVIILKKDEGRVFIPEKSEFYKWTNEEMVHEAFNIKWAKEQIAHINRNLIITEGKTDWKHLKSALEKFKLNGKYIDLDIEFYEYEETMGDANLESLLKSMARFPWPNKIIGLFDNDEKIGRSYDTPTYTSLNNNVFAWCIPNPRKLPYGISIEFLYEDIDIKKVDANGRRLYLSDEFKMNSCRSIKEPSIISHSNKIKDYYKNGIVKIIDSEVFNEDENNIALSKNDFAQNILDKAPPFDSINISNFEAVFDRIAQIIANK